MYTYFKLTKTAPAVLLLLIVLIQTSCKKAEHEPTLNSPTWQPILTAFDTFRSEASSFAIGSNAYFGLGFGSSNSIIESTYYNDFWEFSSTSNKWRRIADFPGNKRSGATSFAINGRGYVAFGYSTICPDDKLCDFRYYKDIWEYNPTNNAWRKVADVDELFAPRYATSFVVDKKAYILIEGKCLEFDPVTYSIRNKSSSPSGMFGGTFSINDKGYAFLGDSDISNRKVYQYDPKTDTWNKKKDFPGQPRVFPTGFSLDGYGYCGGGYRRGNPYNYFKEFWRYNATSDEWIRIEDYPGMGSAWLCSSVVGDKVVIGSGQSIENGYIRSNNDFWLFQPK